MGSILILGSNFNNQNKQRKGCKPQRCVCKRNLFIHLWKYNKRVNSIAMSHIIEDSKVLMHSRYLLTNAQLYQTLQIMRHRLFIGKKRKKEKKLLVNGQKHLHQLTLTAYYEKKKKKRSMTKYGKQHLCSVLVGKHNNFKYNLNLSIVEQNC